MSQQRAIGRYRILERIASGSQGRVYQAYDPETGQIVALKVLHFRLTDDILAQKLETEFITCRCWNGSTVTN